MKIKHHIGGDWSTDQINLLKGYGIYLKEGISTFEIEEGSVYTELQPFFKNWGVLDVIYAEFTKKEKKDALLSIKNGRHEYGYPMPNLNFDYKKLTYNLQDYCEICGVGLKQKDAFRIKSIPLGGKKPIFGLIWIYDELFVERKIYDEIFLPIGIKYRDVYQYKNNIPFSEIVQLIIPETEENLNLENFNKEICSECGRIKYEAMPLNFYPIYKDNIAPIFKSYEYFGSGSNAFKRIFFEKGLRDRLIELKIEKLDWYIPCAE